MRVARRPSTWTLRTRLVVGLVGLMAGISLIVGVISVLALDSFLMKRVDQQLSSTVSRVNQPNQANQFPVPSATSSGAATGTSTSSPQAPAGGGFPGGGPGFNALRAVIRNGTVTTAEIRDSAQNSQALTAAQAEVLTTVATGKPPVTITVEGLGDYRVVAGAAPDGDTIVTGQPLEPIRTTVYELAAVIAGVSLVGLILAAFMGQVLVRSALTPLRRVAATARRVSELPLERGEVALAERVPEEDTDPRTEVGQVGAALNRMLGHVGNALQSRQESETRVRQFVADASHELRTPLASIRGYSELTRRSRQDSPPDVSHALERIESAAARMTSLVEDLLLLARLDSGRPVAAEPLDVSQLVVDALSDAHAAGRDHVWELDLPEEPVTLVGDVERLHQAVANVLANSRNHTPPGTRVVLALAQDDAAGVVTIDITDDGPGIPENLLPTVFERFARGDSSRSRAAGSTGLGLAIVAAIVEAHHGKVDVQSRPGRTSVRMTLPQATAPGPDQVPEPGRARSKTP